MIGILAFQGAFEKHSEVLNRLNIPFLQVRKVADLDECDGLIIPGGESTTMQCHLTQDGFINAFVKFASSKPVFGTCAGLILMASYGFLDIEVKRNGYGRQIESFYSHITVWDQPYKAIFIRAPIIHHVGEGVKVIAELNHQPVFVQQGNHMGVTFHPELIDDDRIHQYFFDQTQKVKRTKRTKGTKKILLIHVVNEE